jgi:sigma-B regulation protein RsbU (phosphoserine phosphatase)
MYNLSPDYLSKGPVILEKHPICQSALLGETIIIPDVSTDPRFGYTEAAKKEGICAMLCTGLKSKDRDIGTLHLYTEEPREFTQDEIMLVQSIANQAAIAIDNAKLYEQSIEKQRIERELVMAGEIQAELLPKESPKIERFDLKVKFLPCSQLSGDLYDFIEFGDRCVGFVIADVSGKGLPSAILMATTHATIRAAAKDDMQKAGKILDAVNEYLCKYTRMTEYVTVFYGVLDAENLTLTYANAGHNPPIIFRDGVGVFLEEGGIPAGIIRDTNYGEEQIDLLPGDIILLYTDGVTEAMNSERKIFGVKRLMLALQKNHTRSSDELVNIIYDMILDFLGGQMQSDDLTLMIINVKNGNRQAV